MQFTANIIIAEHYCKILSFTRTHIHACTHMCIQFLYIYVAL